MQADPSIHALMAEVVRQGDRYTAMGRKAVANNFYNLLPLIAKVRSAQRVKTEENDVVVTEEMVDQAVSIVIERAREVGTEIGAVAQRHVRETQRAVLTAALANMWRPIEKRPNDDQKIIYYFEPFKSVHIGTYRSNFDGIQGPSGFTTVIPEVPFWMPLPAPPAAVGGG